MSEPTIVLVDDDEDMRFLARSALKHIDPHGRFRVLEAPDGPTALRLLQPLLAAKVPVLVLCDQRMPGMSGAEVGRAFRQLRGDAPARFVLFSSLQGGSQIDEARALAADQVLEKGFGTREWRDQIGGVVREWAKQLR